MAGLLFAAALLAAAVGAVVALARLARRSDPGHEWSDEEAERRRSTPGSGLLATSMRVLGEELDAGARRAAEEREALERGERPERGDSGEPPESA